MDLLLFLKIEILCWRIMTPSLRGGSISLGYYTFNRTLLLPRSSRVLLELQTDLTQTVVSIPLFFGN
ncbi:hypothetical protein C2L93_06845 [Coxiella burnetii]|nr:hypothetical protein C2L93_06845 [Coxiella burnetii]